MARHSTDPAAPAPHANLRARQRRVPTPPLTSTPEQQPHEAALLRADEADLLEQLAPLPPDDNEDYPNARVAGLAGNV